jgi:hypothetical protein
MTTGVERTTEVALPSLLRRVRLEPAYAAEHLALEVVARYGGHEAAAAAELRAAHPGSSVGELEDIVVGEFRRRARAAGAMAGGPGALLSVPPLVLVLVLIGQMLLRLSALNGREPRDPVRAAEILVLLGAYPSVDEARNALRQLAEHGRSYAPRRLRVAGVRRLLHVFGVFESKAAGASRLRATAANGVTTGLLVAGLIVPLVGIGLTALWADVYAGRLARRWVAERVHVDNLSSHMVVRPAGPGAASHSWRWFALIVVLGFFQVVAPIVLILVGLRTGDQALAGALAVWIMLALVLPWLWSGWHSRRHGSVAGT